MTKARTIGRRTVLRGMLGGTAVALALPLLEAMLSSHGEALADGTPLPQRFLLWYFGNGVRLDRWLPATQGPGYQLTEELAPLANVRDYCSVLSGFAARTKIVHCHHDGISSLLSGHPFIQIHPSSPGAAFSSKFGGPSIDQVIASHVGSSTYLPSLELGVSKRVSTGEGPTLQYISHKGPDQPAPPEFNPQAAYKRLFALDATETATTLHTSLLDVVKQDADRLKRRVGARDAQRIEAHLESLRQLEKQVAAAAPSCTPPPMPDETNEDVDGIEPLESASRAMADLAAFAFACDATRVVSFMQAGPLSRTVYSPIGTTAEAHELTHDPNEQELVHQSVLFNMKCFAYLLERFADTQDGEGNLLDGSCLMMASEVAEGYTHSLVDQPIVIAGTARGQLVHPGVHYRSATQENTTNILLRIVRLFAPEVTELGGDEGYSNEVFHGLDV